MSTIPTPHKKFALLQYKRPTTSNSAADKCSFFPANLSKYDTSTKLGVNTPWGYFFEKNTLATWNLRWRPFFKMAAILADNLHILLHNLTTVTDLGDIGVKK